MKKILLLKQYLGKCFCNKRTLTEIIFTTVLKICQMYSLSIYLWKFQNICKNLSIYPWLKAIFRKLLCSGCFPENFLQYLRAALYLKVATLNRALHSYFVSLLHWFFLAFRGTGRLLQYSSLQWNTKAIQIRSSTMFFWQEIMQLTFVS